MDLFKVPEAFEESSQALVQSDDFTLIRYKQDQEIEQANVELTQNLVIFVQKGYKVVLGNHQNVQINAGEGLFLRRGKYLLSEKFKETKGYQSLLFFFSDTIAHEFIRDNPIPDSSRESEELIEAFKLDQSLLDYQENMLDIGENASLFSNPAFAQLKLRELFWLLLNSEAQTQFQRFLLDVQTQPSSKLREVMELHYKENLSLSQYAFLADKSLSTFKRHFKDEFDATPNQWIKEKRLNEAKILLRSTPMNVTQVCMEVGFENVSHFVQDFKDRFNITPKQFQLEQLNT